MTKIQEILSYNIKKHREKLGLSQFKLAQLADISQSFLNCIESGTKYPGVVTLEKICSALKLKPYMLYMDIEDVKSFDKYNILTEIKNKINKSVDNIID